MQGSNGEPVDQSPVPSGIIVLGRAQAVSCRSIRSFFPFLVISENRDRRKKESVKEYQNNKCPCFRNNRGRKEASAKEKKRGEENKKGGDDSFLRVAVRETWSTRDARLPGASQPMRVVMPAYRIRITHVLYT